MKPVTIYSTPTCVYCKMAKEFFMKNNISYTEKNVALDIPAREEMFHKSHQFGVPVIEIGEEIFVGFNRPAIEEALGMSNSYGK